MTAHLKPREMGAVLQCDGDGCTERLVTGQILLGSIRDYAATIGWGRGSIASTPERLGTKRHDYCPSCLAKDRAEAKAIEDAKAAKKAERIAKRDAKRKALDAKINAGREAAQAGA